MRRHGMNSMYYHWGVEDFSHSRRPTNHHPDSPIHPIWPMAQQGQRLFIPAEEQAN